MRPMKPVVQLQFIFIFLVLGLNATTAQTTTFTRQDTLRGTITAERAWWDLVYYNLAINVNPETKYISGTNTIYYNVLEQGKRMQIDLQAPLQLEKAIQHGKILPITHEGNAHFVTLNTKPKTHTLDSITLHYKGHPKTAVKAPWDGGITWKKDANNNPFIASACQGIGASVWWPCKDHMYDEVDSMQIQVTVPEKLFNVSNGRLQNITHHNTTKTYKWVVKSPINNYGVSFNIGDYVYFSDQYKGKSGLLDLNYYVLPYHLKKAKVHFKQTHKMLEAFEYWFGPYPFYTDGFKLVETPYLGMEHQSAVTYGNGYKNGYLGSDLSASGWGLKFDFIIIHEAAHEWFANSITNKDIADMWIHESFASYAESLYVEYYFGKTAGAEYVVGTRRLIANDKPIIGTYNVNNEGSSDMYFKGANMLHTLRQWVNNDTLWQDLFLKMNRKFYHNVVTTQEIEKFMSEHCNLDFAPFFNQYLRTTKIPTLEYVIEKQILKYRWTNAVKGFNMPMDTKLNGKTVRLHPTTAWQKFKLDTLQSHLKIDPNYYAHSKQL